MSTAPHGHKRHTTHAIRHRRRARLPTLPSGKRASLCYAVMAWVWCAVLRRCGAARCSAHQRVGARDRGLGGLCVADPAVAKAHRRHVNATADGRRALVVGRRRCLHQCVPHARRKLSGAAGEAQVARPQVCVYPACPACPPLELCAPVELLGRLGSATCDPHGSARGSSATRRSRPSWGRSD